MTGNERAVLCEIGKRAAGPRHAVVLAADPRVVELVSGLAEQGLAESTGFVDREGGEEMLRVCFTGKGWGQVQGRRGVTQRAFPIQADGDGPYSAAP